LQSSQLVQIKGLPQVANNSFVGRVVEEGVVLGA